ncbi:3-deoxy-D-manno-octulosonate 8-phosphate phosphatase, YrbI family [Rhodopirellula maiorica SM1]|uniref:3-deoxy-D-manno-octulosonate 8-phosphate phosphatase, YrbI family n=1 Tax=Rhodopirellula maiorica SM1 TaxID=1265738 RepID=M5R9X9_9BACT|nr:3-deoxy-D-manno-octulosonate 8-phosphate phosphatase, YrbI family [Rhodopirellula maiorica]EMI16190.1 3-deoxy-D-manno-octulosonate 8-phosphate phosphatase, YrbI family [Rhodopirellula maiorica SM1]
MPTKLSTDASIAEPITCIISDVDGVMTDGRIVYDDHGVETKRFHVRDGLGIKLWMRSGFSFAILSARQGNAVKKRAAELGIEHVAQGFEKNGLPRNHCLTPSDAVQNTSAISATICRTLP